jgi:uncharacterized protein (TIGR02231 family)
MWRRVVRVLIVSGLAALLALALHGGPGYSPAAQGQPAAPAGGAAEAVPAPPAAGVRMVASRVSGVTVYANNALVTREVEVPEGLGTIELTVTPLPPTTVTNSLYTEGTEGIRVLSTRPRTRAIREDTREDVRKLQDELRQFQQEQERIEADTKSVQANLQLLTKLEGFAAVTAAHPPEKGLPTGESAIALTKYIMESRAERSKELVGLQQQAQSNQERTDFSRRKLAELAWNPNRTERDAVVVVDKTNAAAGTVRLNYLVDDASWRPQYKLRAGTGAKDPVRLEYLAAVAQHTGEDWSGVRLVLSTAEPALNAAPPDLQVLQVAVVPRASAPQSPLSPAGDPDLEDQVRSLRAKAQKDFNQRKPLNGVGLFNTAAALDQAWELLNPEAAVRRGCSTSFREGPTVTYHLATRMTVPSRADEQTLEVARLDLPPEYYYKAVPVLTSHVYRLARLTNRSNLVLLPGEATLYVGTDFVGQMSLPLVAIGEPFTAGFGVDPQLQVQRQIVNQSRSTHGGNEVRLYEYRIALSSYKAEPVPVQVWDRLPHAPVDTVGVSLVKATPEVSRDELYSKEQRPDNLLRWDVTLEPGMNGLKALAIDYEFKLEHDKTMAIANFQTSGVARAEAPPPAAMRALTVEEVTKVKAALAKLSPEDRQLAESQVWCVVDPESPLGISGPPHKLTVKGQPMFVCCKGCLAEARAHPDQTLTDFQKLMARMKGGPPSK